MCTYGAYAFGCPFVLVDLIGIEPTTLRMRTVRSPKCDLARAHKIARPEALEGGSNGMRTICGPDGMRTTRWYSTNDSHPAKLIGNLDWMPAFASLLKSCSKPFCMRLFSRSAHLHSVQKLCLRDIEFNLDAIISGQRHRFDELGGDDFLLVDTG